MANRLPPYIIWTTLTILVPSLVTSPREKFILYQPLAVRFVGNEMKLRKILVLYFEITVNFIESLIQFNPHDWECSLENDNQLVWCTSTSVAFLYFPFLFFYEGCKVKRRLLVRPFLSVPTEKSGSEPMYRAAVTIAGNERSAQH